MTRTIEKIAVSGLAALLIALIAGCDAEIPVLPDASVENDAGEMGTGGLSLMFLAEITAPDGGEPGAGLQAATGNSTRFLGIPDNQTRVQRVDLQLEAIRAIGDTGAEEVERLDLAWNEGGARCQSFAEAQPGRYSQFKADVMSYRIQGLTATELNPNQPFTIEDVPPSGITVIVTFAEKSVEIGETTPISLLFRSRSVADAVNWNAVEAGEAGAVVTGENPQLPAVRAAIVEAMITADEQPALECSAGPPPEGVAGAAPEAPEAME